MPKKDKKDKKPKIFLGNNLSAKVRSSSFWTGMIPALATFIVSVCSLLGIDIAEDVINQYQALGGLVISVLTSIGVLVSHDTKGFSDSPMVKSFNKPRDYKDPKQSINYESKVEEGISSERNLKEELGILTPKEYDTSQPFTDDTDEDEEAFTNEGGGSPDNLDESELDKSKEEALVNSEDSKVLLETPDKVIKEVEK